MAFSQTYLERLRRSRAEPGEHPDTVQELIREARAAGHTGPLVLGPPRASLKSSWRDEAKWLEENCLEEFGPSRGKPGGQAPFEIRVEERPREPSPESTLGADGSSRSGLTADDKGVTVSDTLEPLPASWWQSLMYGSPDALLSAVDATRAMHLIAQALLVERGPSEFSEGVRVVALRKLLEAHFGAAQAWQAMHGLWRSAPTSLGASEPNIDQSRCTPGVWDCPRSMPSWRRDFHQEVSDDRRLLESMGGWAGG